MGKNTVHGREKKKKKKKEKIFLSRFHGNNFAFIRNIINKTDKTMEKKEKKRGFTKIFLLEYHVQVLVDRSLYN